jgi:hypothetical protein
VRGQPGGGATGDPVLVPEDLNDRDTRGYRIKIRNTFFFSEHSIFFPKEITLLKIK